MEYEMKLGDKLKAINVLDDDGEPCDGGLQLDEVVTLVGHPLSDWIIIERANGRKFQYEKSRFVPV
jgi:hypothetical protein